MQISDDISSLLHLASLPRDELITIAYFLCDEDVLALACTCKRLCSILQEATVWEHRIAEWVQRQDPRSRMPGTSAQQLCASLGLTDLRSTYQALVGLGGWPAGLWWAESAAQPRGVLVQVEHHRAHFVLAYVAASIDVTQPWPHRQPRASKREFGHISVVAATTTWQGEAAKIVAEWQSTMRIVRARWEPDAMHLVQEAAPLPPVPGWQQLARSSPFGRRAERVLMRRAAALPHPPPATLSYDHGLHLLSMLQGVHVASYAGHGVEVLRVTLADPAQPPPPGCTITGPRLEAQKLTGDANVPASRVSFVVAAAGWCRGPYHSQRDDPFRSLSARPLVAFPAVNAHPELVDLSDRPVAAVFSLAAGQINRVPGTWAPEWEPATVVVYREQRYFSVIFEQPDASVRLVEDFFPVGPDWAA